MKMRDIPGYEGLYAATEDGQIWSYRSNKFLKQNKGSNGYLKVNLSKDGVSHTYAAHKLIAITLIPNPDNLPEINHKDENKLNNAVSNLEWISRIDNLNYGTRNQRISRRVYCVETGEQFRSIRAAALAINMTSAAISHALKTGRCCKDYHWKYVEEEIAC